MKVMKKLASVLLALVMVMSLTANVWGATITNNGTHTYEVYQIFTGDLDGKTLSNVKWGQNGKETTDTAVAKDVLDALVAVSDKSDVEQLAVITQYADLTGDPYKTIASESTLEGVPTGYYLIKDVDGAVTGNDTHTLYIVKIVGDLTIEAKGDKPEVEKKVDDEYDSSSAEDGENWQDSADYDIGDSVPFQITATLPSNYDEYKVYSLTFVDTMAEGLTYNGDVKVTFGEQNITDSFTVSTKTEGTDTVITITCAALKNIQGLTNSSEIVVTYSATLNNKADIGAPGNSNKVKIQYTNDPNWDGTGDKTPTGETPEDVVVVFTYELDIDKVNESSQPLPGAGFTLYKKNASGEYVAVGGEKTGAAMTEFVWAGLDDGEYKLAETTTPAGYNTIEPIEFTISAEHDTEADEPKLTSLTTTLKDATADPATGIVSGSIMNMAGTVLPETGGMGTTILYIVGGVLVLAAVVLLVTKRRMKDSE